LQASENLRFHLILKAMTNLLQRIAYAAAVLFPPAWAAVIGGELEGRHGQPLMWDKLLHFIAYFGLSVLLTLILQPRRKVLLGMLALVAMGGALEIVQGLIGRDASFLDELANTLGVIAGAAVARLSIVLLVDRGTAR
jgi:VanZ family protein